MSDHIKITIEDITREQRDVLVALLGEQGFDGFEEGHSYLLAYIPEGSFDADELNGLSDQYAFKFTIEKIEEQNWNEAWEKNFHPVVIDNFCAIRASFHPAVGSVKYDLVITPKMSFGTGHHATTHMMVQWMQKDGYAGKRVLDFGTGTGVLAILAEKLGAKDIEAIDNDDWSIDNANENFHLNGTRYVHLQKADFLHFERGFDIILANINRNVLLANMKSLQQHLNPGGVLILSGLLEGDKNIIEAAASETGLNKAGDLQREGWIALRFEKRN
jgi:ribosomal protein L11 methyltransferase